MTIPTANKNAFEWDKLTAMKFNLDNIDLAALLIHPNNILNAAPPVPKQKEKKEYISDFYKYTPLNKYEGLTGKLEVRAGTTFVGLEIELEQVEFNSAIGGTWATTEDNSLKDNGKEFITKPIQFKYLEVELERLKGGLSHYKASKRCSVHTHINVRDLSLQELKTFIVLYMIFEKSLYNYSGNRWDNNFCVPLHFYPESVKRFLGSIDTGAIYERWYKYFGFNLSPIFGGESSKIGTVEFRHMVGTLEIPYIINWVNLIVSLKLMAKKLPYADLETDILSMNTTSSYYTLAEKVFREYAGILTRQETFQNDVELCVSRLKKVIFKDVPCVEEFAFNLGRKV